MRFFAEIKRAEGRHYCLRDRSHVNNHSNISVFHTQKPNLILNSYSLARGLWQLEETDNGN